MYKEVRLKRKILGAFVILIALGSIITYLLTQYTLSRGVRAGKLVKLSETGILIKTYEGTLDLGSGDELTWQFSIHDSDLGEELAKQTGKQVRLEYRVLLAKLFYTTRYDITSWSLEGESQSMNLLCRLVDFMRDNSSVVEYLRPIIQERDPELLRNIRECQKRK